MGRAESDVLPDLPQLYAAYLSLMNSVFSSDVFLSAKVCADSKNLRGGQLSPAVFNSLRLPSLCNHVRHICRMSVEPKVIDVDVSSDVAFVANKPPGRDRAIRLFPNETMHPVHSSLPIIGSVSPAHCAQPQATPSCVRFRCVMRETFGKRPMTRADKSLSFGGSHISTSHAVVGQGRCRRSSVARPAHSITTQVELRMPVADRLSGGYTHLPVVIPAQVQPKGIPLP